jgi:hypothetical protein
LSWSGSPEYLGVGTGFSESGLINVTTPPNQSKKGIIDKIPQLFSRQEIRDAPERGFYASK